VLAVGQRLEEFGCFVGAVDGVYDADLHNDRGVGQGTMV
jgi:hypothetical protein